MRNIVFINKATHLIWYGLESDTTVLYEMGTETTLKLKGDHSTPLIRIAERGVEACKAYFNAMSNQSI